MKRRLLSLLLTVGVGFSHVNTLVFAEEDPEQPEITEETTAGEPEETETPEQEIVTEEEEADPAEEQVQEEILPEAETEEPAEEEEITEEPAEEEAEAVSEETEITEEAVDEETEEAETEYQSDLLENSDYAYIIENNEVTIKKFKQKEGKEVAVVPTTLSGYPVTKIASEAFLGPGITRVRIPSSVTWIESNAFTSCYDLTKVYIPASVTVTKSLVGSLGMFRWCTGLTSAGPTGSGANIEFGWTDTIPEYAFSGHSDLKTITFPGSLKEIGQWAFRDTSLSSVTIPDTVQKIGSTAFAKCTSLSKVNIPKSVTEMNGDIFNGCTNLKTAGPVGSGSNIEFGWTDEIPDAAFLGDDKLTKITIPEGITKIGWWAFNQCDSLNKIIIPGSVSEVEFPVFQPSPLLKSAGPVGSGANIEFGWTESIPEDTFRQCSSLTKITIPASIKTIGRCAFEGCSGLTGFIIPKSVKEMGSSVFAGCTGLTSAGPTGSGSKIEFGWTDAIPAYAFSYMNQLESIQIPAAVTSIGRNAFIECIGLTQIAIPPGVTVIEMQTFENCSSLTSIDLSNVKTIDGYAFSNCTKLSEIHMSNQLKTVYESAFNGIVSKPTVYFKGTQTDWDSIKISNYNDPLRNATVIFSKLPAPKSISITNGTSIEIKTGRTRQLTVSASPAGSDTAVTWTSSNPKVATVSADGKVTALAYGKTVITAVSKANTGVKSEITVQTRFKDVADATQSYFKPVYWGADNGVVAGYNGGEYFGPDNECTRGQFVTFLWRLAGRPEGDKEVSFPDVDESANYYRAVKWAVSKGIIVGYKHDDGTVTFEPESEVTRGQTAVMLWRFAGRPKVNTSVASPFNDIDAKNNQYRAVLWGQQAGVIKGYKDGSFQPDGSCLRQHIVTFFYRYARDVMKRKV